MLLLVVAAEEEASVPWKIEYSVTNKAATTAGGIRFENELGQVYAKRTMLKATNLAWRVFNQFDYPSRRKPVYKIELLIQQFDLYKNASGVRYVAYVVNGSFILMDANYLETYTGNLKREFNGLVYNQVANILQWKGNGEAPVGVTSGIADYVRMKGGYDGSLRVAVGQGTSWDSGYDVTAKFLEYCNKLKRGFVGELNAKMRNGYTVGYFVDILGKNVNQLWSEYKTLYNKGN
ncbi:Basic secretory protease (Fragments) [Linum perenne]